MEISDLCVKNIELNYTMKFWSLEHRNKASLKSSSSS
jgi:hypothetical protein